MLNLRTFLPSRAESPRFKAGRKGPPLFGSFHAETQYFSYGQMVYCTFPHQGVHISLETVIHHRLRREGQHDGQKKPALPMKKPRQKREARHRKIPPFAQMYRFQAYPTKNQIGKMEWILRRIKELYNAALEERTALSHGWRLRQL